MTNPKHPVFALVALAAALVMYGVGPTDGAPGLFEQLKIKGVDELVRLVTPKGKPVRGPLGKWRSIGLGFCKSSFTS